MLQDDENMGEDDTEDDDWSVDKDSTSMATGSFVKVEDGGSNKIEALPEDDGEPDFYDVDVLSWDLACSPLHLAILNGHADAVKVLVESFGADLLLPVKLLNDYDNSPRAAILTLVLALCLPQQVAENMAKVLLDLGATSRQADLNGVTALQYFVNNGPNSLDFMLRHDRASAVVTLNHISVSKNTWSPATNSALLTAISNSDTLTALKILEHGVAPDIAFPAWVKEAKTSFENNARNRISNDPDHAMSLYRRSSEQPIVVAVGNDATDIALALLEAGADANSLPKTTAEILDGSYGYRAGISLLDVVRIKLEKLVKYDGEPEDEDEKPLPLSSDDCYLQNIALGSYKHWAASAKLMRAKERYVQELRTYNDRKAKPPRGLAEKKEAVALAITGYTELEAALLRHGAKTFKELHPNIPSQDIGQDAPYRRYREVKKPFEVMFQFRVGELHDELRERYIQL